MSFSSIIIIFAILIAQSIAHVDDRDPCSLECYCDVDGDAQIPCVNNPCIQIPCVNNRCTARAPPEKCNSTKPACYISTIFSTRPYNTERYCGYTHAKMENFLMPENVVFAWKYFGKYLAVYHKCEKTPLCNANYTVAKIPNVLEKIRDQFGECLPVTTRRMEEVLTVRRNFSDPLKCFCDTGKKCKNGRCSSVGENETARRGFMCQTVLNGGGQCQKAEGDLQKIVHDYAASIATNYLETIYLAGCRHRDLCNSNLPKGSKVTVRNLFCQWMCPKLSLKKLQFEWWIALISLIFLMFVLGGIAVCFLLGRYRLTVRLQV